MIEPQGRVTRQIRGAATRFLAWRAGHQMRAIDRDAMNEVAQDAQEFARLMRRVGGRRHRATRPALAPE